MSFPLHSANSPANGTSASTSGSSPPASTQATAVSSATGINCTDDAAQTLFEVADGPVAEGDRPVTATALPASSIEQVILISDDEYDSDLTVYKLVPHRAIKTEDTEDCTMTDTADKSASAGAMKSPANRPKANGGPAKKQQLKRVRSDNSVCSATAGKRTKPEAPPPPPLARPSRRMPTFQGGPTPAFNAGNEHGDDSFM